MANAHKGEVELHAEGKTFVLRYSINAICSLEDRLGLGFPVIASRMMNPATISLSLMRSVVLAGLEETHPEVTLEEAGNIVVKAGGIIAVMKQVNLAFGRAFPKDVQAGAKAANKEGVKTDPPVLPGRTRRPTGSASSKAGSPTV